MEAKQIGCDGKKHKVFLGLTHRERTIGHTTLQNTFASALHMSLFTHASFREDTW